MKRVGLTVAFVAAAAWSIYAQAQVGLPSVIGDGGGATNSGSVCVLWTPLNEVTAARYRLDPSQLTYSGSNFASGTNSGSVGGAWTAETGTITQGSTLNGLTTIAFDGTSNFINTTAAWPSGANVYVFAVVKVSASQANGLASHSWGSSEGRNAGSWTFYPRGGNGFGGSANEGWLFNGSSTAFVITRGDLLTDTNYHIITAKIGSSVEMSVDGTAVSPTTATGVIGASPTANFRIGATGPSAQEAITGNLAYLEVLVDPVMTDVQKLQGWAAATWGLVSQLDAGNPYKTAAPCQSGGGGGGIGGGGGGPVGCVTSPCDPPPLTWAQIQSDNGTLATRQPIQSNGYGTQHDTGVYPYGISFFSWELSGFEYLGDPLRPVDSGCPSQKGFSCTSMTAWHIVYPEAASYPFGPAKPSVAGVHVIYRNYQSWCHFVSGGWFLAQDAATFGDVTTNELTAKQDGFIQSQVTTVSNGEYSMLGPTVGNANHGWITARGNFGLHTVDHCYMQYEVRVDQPGANLLAGTGIDWWQNNGAAYPNNFEHSHGTWLRITQDWQRQTGTSAPLSLLQSDPPPPLVGIN